MRKAEGANGKDLQTKLLWGGGENKKHRRKMKKEGGAVFTGEKKKRTGKKKKKSGRGWRGKEGRCRQRLEDRWRCGEACVHREERKKERRAKLTEESPSPPSATTRVLFDLL